MLSAQQHSSSSPSALIIGSFVKSKQNIKWGVLISLISAIVWILIETVLCPMDDYRFGKEIVGYIPGHAVWHIGMSYGLSLAIIWFITMDSVLEKREYFGYKTFEERIIKCPGKCACAQYINRVLHYVFPIITNNRESAKKEESSKLPHLPAMTSSAGLDVIHDGETAGSPRSEKELEISVRRLRSEYDGDLRVVALLFVM